MEFISKSAIKSLLKKYNARPSKGLGQNFLVDQKILEKIIRFSGVGVNDTVLEIGPGAGNLTRLLAQKAKTVIAVEKDPKMCEILKETLGEFKNLEIIQADILKIPNSQLPITNYKIVANLPFYLTAPVIRKFLESNNPPAEMVLVVQKEVAQRITAIPPRMSLLTVSVQFYAKPKILDYVSKESFWPQPKVDAAILRIAPLMNTDKKQVNTDLFFKIVRAGFSHPRKQLANNLSSGLVLPPLASLPPIQARLATDGALGGSPSNGLVLSPPNGLKLDKPRSRKISLRGKENIKSWLLKNKINPERRAETLSLKDWLTLTKNFNVFLFVLFCFVV